MDTRQADRYENYVRKLVDKLTLKFGNNAPWSFCYVIGSDIKTYGNAAINKVIIDNQVEVFSDPMFIRQQENYTETTPATAVVPTSVPLLDLPSQCVLDKMNVKEVTQIAMIIITSIRGKNYGDISTRPLWWPESVCWLTKRPSKPAKGTNQKRMNKQDFLDVITAYKKAMDHDQEEHIAPPSVDDSVDLQGPVPTVVVHPIDSGSLGDNDDLQGSVSTLGGYLIDSGSLGDNDDLQGSVSTVGGYPIDSGSLGDNADLQWSVSTVGVDPIVSTSQGCNATVQGRFITLETSNLEVITPVYTDHYTPGALDLSMSTASSYYPPTADNFDSQDWSASSNLSSLPIYNPQAAADNLYCQDWSKSSTLSSLPIYVSPYQNGVFQDAAENPDQYTYRHVETNQNDITTHSVQNMQLSSTLSSIASQSSTASETSSCSGPPPKRNQLDLLFESRSMDK